MGLKLQIADSIRVCWQSKLETESGGTGINSRYGGLFLKKEKVMLSYYWYLSLWIVKPNVLDTGIWCAPKCTLISLSGKSNFTFNITFCHMVAVLASHMLVVNVTRHVNIWVLCNGTGVLFAGRYLGTKLAHNRRSKMENKICWHSPTSKFFFFWNYLSLFCLFIMTWCNNYSENCEKYQNMPLLSVCIGTRISCKWIWIQTPISMGRYQSTQIFC